MKYWLLLFYVLATNPLLAETKLPLTEVSEGVFVHFGVHKLPDQKNHGAIANIGFIVGDNCVAVVDTGGNPEQGRLLLQSIENITTVPVCYVINTHVHPDHINGNIAFQKGKVKFIGHYKLARAMQSRADYYVDKAQQQLGIKFSRKDIILPDVNVKKQMQLDLGNRKLILNAHQTAHTDNDLSVLDIKTDTLWLSDLLFIEHIPVIDGSTKGWINELENLKKQDFKTVIPGHGPVVRDWPKAVEPELSYLKMLVTEIREQLRQGKFLEQAISTVGLAAKGKWLLYDQFHVKNVTSSFAELEWED